MKKEKNRLSWMAISIEDNKIIAKGKTIMSVDTKTGKDYIIAPIMEGTWIL